MISREINSLQHPLIKYAVKLRTDRSFREKENKVLISGIKMVEELSSNGSFDLLITSSKELASTYKAKECILVSEDILKKITGLQSPEPLAAIVEKPKAKDLSSSRYLLVLDRIADPGNLGTLLRNALGLGWDGVFLLEPCCDPYNDKALRAAKGATFHIPIYSGSWHELDDLLQKTQVKLITADSHGESVDKMHFNTPIALLLGNESSGPSSRAKDQSTLVSIPMHGGMESLNVASAGAILLYYLRNGSL